MDDVGKLSSEEIEKKYFDPENPGSYAGLDKFHKSLDDGKTSRDEIRKVLKSQDAYTLHYPVRHRFPRRRVIVAAIDQLWEADLLFMTDLTEQNSDWAYILTVIDVLSKFAFCERLKNKTAAHVAAAFAKILERARPRKPASLRTDAGSEFIARPFKALMSKNGIRHYVTSNTETKASVCER